MPTSQVTAPFMQPALRVFLHLDTDALSDDFKEMVGETEGTYEWVDAGRARDFELTEEIMRARIGAALVDAQGSIVQTFDGPDGFKNAERAKASARIVFDYEIPETADADDESVPAGFEK